MQLLSLPSLGSNFIVRTNGLNGGPAAMIVGLAAANATLTHPLFTSGCTLLARPDIVQTMTVFSTLALYTLPIPNNPSLTGTQIHVQALELIGQWTLSQGGVGVIN
jgi:hypothetical protein